MKEGLEARQLADEIAVLENGMLRLSATVAQTPAALTAAIADANARAAAEVAATAARGSLPAGRGAGDPHPQAVETAKEMMVLRDALRVTQERLEVEG